MFYPSRMINAVSYLRSCVKILLVEDDAALGHAMSTSLNKAGYSVNWAHDGFWILLTNMIWLTAFGIVLQESNANKHLFPVYFYGGLVAGIVYCFLGSSTPLIGASSSVMAIATAALLLQPQYRLLKNIGGGIPLWVLGLCFIVLQGFSFIHIQWATILASLIGAATGALYILLLKKGIDLGKWMHQLLHLLNNSLAPKNNSSI